MSSLQTGFWYPVSIPPIPRLAQLRDLVLSHSEKRSPKWKFRLAPDLAVQIQAKLTTGLIRFECVAATCDRPDASIFGSGKDIDQDYWRLGFEVRSSVPETWTLKPRSVSWRPRRSADWDQGESPATRYAKNLRSVEALRERVVTLFRDGVCFGSLQPITLLSPNCVICGKGLTDPVSMARFIGPECAGTSSPDLRRVFKLDVQRRAEEASEPLQHAV